MGLSSSCLGGPSSCLPAQIYSPGRTAITSPVIICHKNALNGDQLCGAIKSSGVWDGVCVSSIRHSGETLGLSTGQWKLIFLWVSTIRVWKREQGGREWRESREEQDERGQGDGRESRSVFAFFLIQGGLEGNSAAGPTFTLKSVTWPLLMLWCYSRSRTMMLPSFSCYVNSKRLLEL